MTTRKHMMKPTSFFALFGTLGLCIAVLLSAPNTAAAATINIDFGTIDGSASGSFGAAVADGNSVGGTWNVLNGGGSIGVGSVEFDDGSTATGVSITATDTFGGTGGSGPGLATSDVPSNAALTEDFLLNLGTAAGDGEFVSSTISGLAPGRYNVYAMAGSNGATSDTYDITFLVGGSTVSTLSVGPIVSTTDWIEGQNFVQQIVTISAGQTLEVRSNATERRFDVLNGLQIVEAPSAPAPEPSTLILAALGFVGLVGTRRRRRK